MGRIPDAELERLKRDVAVERLAQMRGVVLEPHGGNLIGLCPFHDDHEASFVVTPAKNLWHCLGACQAGGSVIDFVMRVEDVSFRHAVELLRSELGGAGPTRTAGAELPIAAPDADDRALLRDVVGYCHQTLTESPDAARISGEAGAALVRDDHALPARVCQPHARLSAAGTGAGQAARAAAGASLHISPGFCCERG